MKKIKIKLWHRWLLVIALSLIYLISLAFLDVNVLSPLLLPDDYCYYHFHDTPIWVELFYMSPGNNGHPEPLSTLPHLILLLGISYALGFYTARLFLGVYNNHKTT